MYRNKKHFRSFAENYLIKLYRKKTIEGLIRIKYNEGKSFQKYKNTHIKKQILC